MSTLIDILRSFTESWGWAWFLLGLFGCGFIMIFLEQVSKGEASK